jgi:glyoxylase-like metal-dependent hydrolase (beta-lactamase superfamily II)
MHKSLRRHVFCLAALAASSLAHSAPDHVDITWMSIANMHFDLGRSRVLADGYITRLPSEIFYGGGGGFAATHRAMRPDTAAVKEVFHAIGGKPAVNLLLTGHSHWDHSFDTATWAKLSGARIIGSPTTCLQVRAAKIAARRCTPVYGGEKFTLEHGVDMYVIRWNHSGDPAKNGEQHNPVELVAVPKPDHEGALRAGVAEDFPNGGGNRAYLFVVDGPGGRFSWLFQDSASAVDLREPIVIDDTNHGAPLDNLRLAMKAAGLDSVDLWIATGGREVAELVLPVLRPKAYLPVHWDGLFGAFKAGPPQPYQDATLLKLLDESGVQLVVPLQYMDRWRLDRNGIRAMENSRIKQVLGFR